jgi:hypothetical protein
MEFNTEFLQFSSLGTSIYKLRVQMGECCDKYGLRLDGGHGLSRRTTVRPEFSRFSLKIIPV